MELEKYQKAAAWPENRGCTRRRRSGRIRVKEWKQDRWEVRMDYVPAVFPRSSIHPLAWWFLGSAAAWVGAIWVLWRWM